MTWTVKEAIEETIGIGKPWDAARLKVEDTFYHIGRADSYDEAMETFAEFLDAEAINYHSKTENGKKIAEIVVSKDEVDINDVNGLKFTRRYRYKETVKEALERAFSNPECKRVYLKSKKIYSNGKADFYQIGYANTLEEALRTFGGFLHLKAVELSGDWRTTHIFVNGDDIVKIKIETDSEISYRFYANPKLSVLETVIDENLRKESKESKESNMFENLKRGCVAENAEKINIQELKAFLEHKDDVVSALQQKIIVLKNEIADCIGILRVLDSEQAESYVNGLKLFIMTLEEE